MSGNYEGDVTVDECWSALSDDPEAFLIDVRTAAEWTYVGVPVAPADARQPVFAEWQSFPSMQADPAFADKLGRHILGSGGTHDTRLYFLCRSGARSMATAAAMTAAGFAHCFNVIDGFEGPVDESGHRGRAAGWKAEGLPWQQR
ncbi:rhodanese-like domain-containing protein [Aureimonas leprariae]|uniref:Rhodanese-like domain-containing protein n=1 Tax=Plantimonas leprariae TaxID=2615207 RepID=A0A7V7PT60_9HYPH|nr:rhodanese-like domain-containing protein [Aureimonas leprariae]KAB0682822.1 rhodanese-like domain-containing protein [Aureimonas leprariae]